MAKAYEVLTIDELVRIAPAGGVERYYRHRVKTAGGVVLTVDIGEKEFTPEKAAPILTAAAANADKIKAL